MGESSELFVNCLEAMVLTCLPIDENATFSRPYHLSSSLSSLTLSPTDKGKHTPDHYANYHCQLFLTNFLFIFDVFNCLMYSPCIPEHLQSHSIATKASMAALLRCDAHHVAKIEPSYDSTKVRRMASNETTNT